jgi:hypothetical protein
VQVVDDDLGTFTVKGTSGKIHKVSFASPSCTCRDWITFHLPCKHFFGIFRLHSKWDWNSLPESYRNSAYLTTDQGAIEDFFQPPEDLTDHQLQERPPEPSTCSITTGESKIPERKVLTQVSIQYSTHCYMYIRVRDITCYVFLIFLQTLVQSLKQEGEHARTALKVLETLTYSCINPNDLHEIATKLEELILALRKKLPKSEGIILRPEARKAARKRAQKISRKYRPLPSSVKRGRPRNDWRYQNRVGKKADELRKVLHSNSNYTYMYMYLTFKLHII